MLLWVLAVVAAAAVYRSLFDQYAGSLFDQLPGLRLVKDRPLTSWSKTSL